MHILASCLRLLLPTLNTSVKNREEIERSHIQFAPFFKQQKLLKPLSLEKLENLCLLHGSYVGLMLLVGTHLKQMALHITTSLGIDNFLAPADGSTCLRGET
jgi:hypothetical protein